VYNSQHRRLSTNIDSHFFCIIILHNRTCRLAARFTERQQIAIAFYCPFSIVAARADGEQVRAVGREAGAG
jgi:hypothetical protein